MANPLPLPPDPIAQPRRKDVPVSKPDADEGNVTDNWSHWLVELSKAVGQASSQIATPTQLTGIVASVPTTSITLGLTAAGLYRITYYMRCAVVAGVSSGLQVSFSWTDHGQPVTVAFATMTGNTLTTVQTNTIMVYNDAAIPLSYSLTYASNPAGVAQFEFYMTIESMGL